VGVLGFVLDGGVRFFDVQQTAELTEEQLRVGEFGGGGILPAADEVLRCHAGQSNHDRTAVGSVRSNLVLQMSRYSLPLPFPMSGLGFHESGPAAVPKA